MARAKKPKVQIKRQKTSLGWVPRLRQRHLHGDGTNGSFGPRCRKANARDLWEDEGTQVIGGL